MKQKGFFALLWNTWKRFETDEVKNTTVRIKAPNEITLRTETDTNGYYLLTETYDDLSRFANLDGWLPIEASFVAENLNRGINDNNRFPGEMLIPCTDSDYGVISDIDDTILHPGVVSSLK